MMTQLSDFVFTASLACDPLRSLLNHSNVVATLQRAWWWYGGNDLDIAMEEGEREFVDIRSSVGIGDRDLMESDLPADNRLAPGTSPFETDDDCRINRFMDESLHQSPFSGCTTIVVGNRGRPGRQTHVMPAAGTRGCLLSFVLFGARLAELPFSPGSTFFCKVFRDF